MSQMALREAFRSGAFFARRKNLSLYPYSDSRDMVLAEAKDHFPIKTEERPRVIQATFRGDSSPSLSYRFVDGNYEAGMGGNWWRAYSVRVENGEVIFDPKAFSPESVVELLELYHNPTETVELED